MFLNISLCGCNYICSIWCFLELYSYLQDQLSLKYYILAGFNWCLFDVLSEVSKNQDMNDASCIVKEQESKVIDYLIDQWIYYLKVMLLWLWVVPTLHKRWLAIYYLCSVSTLFFLSFKDIIRPLYSFDQLLFLFIKSGQLY